MTLKEAIERYTNNADYESIYGSMQECLDFRQLAEWLKDYKRLLEQEPCTDAVSREAVKEALRNRKGESISECINAIPPINLIPCEDVVSREMALEKNG